jgi:hypothetical protein
MVIRRSSLVRSEIAMNRLLFISVMVVWLALSGGTALAQTQPPDLIVTLHDVANAPLPGVMVIVRDGGGSHTLAQAATDAHGVATFSNLMESQVRIAIVGVLPNGTRLYQPGNDAAGISLLLDPLPATLALRSAADGMIVPDPAAMAREPGIPIATEVAVIPTAPVAPTVSVTQAVAPPPAAVPQVAAGAATEGAGLAGGQTWFGVVLLALLIGAGIGIVVLQRRSA